MTGEKFCVLFGGERKVSKRNRVTFYTSPFENIRVTFSLVGDNQTFLELAPQ